MGSAQSEPRLNLDESQAGHLRDLTVRKYTSEISKYDDSIRRSLEIKEAGDYPLAKVKGKWRRSAEYLEYAGAKPPVRREPPNNNREKYIRSHTVLPFDSIVHGRVWDTRVGKVVTWIEGHHSSSKVATYKSCIAKVHPTGRLLTKSVCSEPREIPVSYVPIAKVLRKNMGAVGEYSPGDILEGATVAGYVYGEIEKY